MAKNNKWLIPILGLSLAVNLFIGGIMLGKSFNDPPSRPGRGPRVDFDMQRFGQHLSQTERKKIRKIFRDERGALSDHYHSVKQSEEQIKKAISAPQVDRQALLKALKDHGALMQQLHAPMQRVMMEVVAELSQETRKKMAGDMFKGDLRRRMGSEGKRFRRKSMDKRDSTDHDQPADRPPLDAEPNSGPESL